MTLQIKKHAQRFTSPIYLQFIREQPCIVCARLGMSQTLRTQASHTVSKRRAEGSDADCIPVCQTHHPQSTKSANEVLAEAGISIEAAVAGYQRRFASKHGYTEPIDFEHWCLSLKLGNFDDKSKRKNRRKYTPYKKPF